MVVPSSARASACSGVHVDALRPEPSAADASPGFAAVCGVAFNMLPFAAVFGAVIKALLFAAVFGVAFPLLRAGKWAAAFALVARWLCAERLVLDHALSLYCKV